MASITANEPVSPVLQRDIRSAAHAFKRDKDASEKWSNGVRPSTGISYAPPRVGATDDELIGGSNDSQREKVRPRKQWSQVYETPPSRLYFREGKLIKTFHRTSDYKSHANKNPRSSSNSGYYFGSAAGRLDRKVDAKVEANDSTSNLSKSLLELLPQHANNTNSTIHTALRDANADAGVLYSFDSRGASPGSSVALGGLVERAEKKWLSEQTDRILRGEYEVLDADGETTVLKGANGKKKSPKQKAARVIQAKDVEDEDDGFELV